jgi:hypothetical protein
MFMVALVTNRLGFHHEPEFRRFPRQNVTTFPELGNRDFESPRHRLYRRRLLSAARSHPPMNSSHYYFRTPTGYHPASETASERRQEPDTKPESKREMCGKSVLAQYHRIPRSQRGRRIAGGSVLYNPNSLVNPRRRRSTQTLLGKRDAAGKVQIPPTRKDLYAQPAHPGT